MIAPLAYWLVLLRDARTTEREWATTFSISVVSRDRVTARSSALAYIAAVCPGLGESSEVRITRTSRGRDLRGDDRFGEGEYVYFDVRPGPRT